MNKRIEYLIFKQVSPWSQKSFLQKFNRFCLLAYTKKLSIKGQTRVHSEKEWENPRLWQTTEGKWNQLVKTRLRSGDMIFNYLNGCP